MPCRRLAMVLMSFAHCGYIRASLRCRNNQASISETRERRAATFARRQDEVDLCSLGCTSAQRNERSLAAIHGCGLRLSPSPRVKGVGRLYGGPPHFVLSNSKQ